MTTHATEFDTRLQKGESEAILQVLCDAYPDHGWKVMVRGGVVFIRHLDFMHVDGYGMNLKWSSINHDAAVIKRSVIFAAGEWLERAGLARGRANGDEIVRVDGVKEKHQPGYVAPINMQVVYAPSDAERTRPRPQAVIQAAQDGE